MLVPTIKDGDWTSVRKAIQKLAGPKLGKRSTPRFAKLTLNDLTLNDLTASKLLSSDSSKVLTSVADLTAWIAGTINQVTVTDDEDGTITLSTPQSIHTGASPTFVGLTLSSIAAEGTDVDKFLVDSSGVIKYRTGAQVLSDIGGSASGHTHDDRYYTETEIRYYTETEIDAGYQPLDAGLTSLAGLTYTSDSFIKVTAEDTYVIRTIAETKTDLSLNLVENTALTTWAGTENITTLGTVGTGVWEGTSISTTYTDAKCTEASPDYTYISGNDGDTDVTGAELEELSDGSETALHSHAGIGTDELVKIDAAAVAGYIGAASNDGVLRTGSSLSYVDSGDFVTLDTVQAITTASTPTFGGVIIADGGTIGQAAGPLLNFDDTNNYLEITGCKVGIGTATPATLLEIYETSLEPTLRGFVFTQDCDTAQGFSLVCRKLRTGQTAEDDDNIGGISFKFYNDAGTPEIMTAATVKGIVKDVSDGTEDGRIEFKTLADGSDTLTLVCESGLVGIGNISGTPEAKLEVLTTTALSGITIRQYSDDASAGTLRCIKERGVGQTCQDNDNVGNYQFYFYNDAGTPELIQAGHFKFVVTDVSNGSEDAYFRLATVAGGAEATICMKAEDGCIQLPNIKSGATQAAAGAATDEIYKTNGHASLPNNVLMIGV